MKDWKRINDGRQGEDHAHKTLIGVRRGDSANTQAGGHHEATRKQSRAHACCMDVGVNGKVLAFQ
jgi:hypothetical protein